MSIDLFAPEAHRDPYPVYRALRESRLGHDRERDWWLVSRHADVLDVLRTPQVFSVEGVASFESTLLGCDPPRHTAVRALVEEQLNLRTTSAWEPKLRAHARRLVERARTQSTFDAIADLACPLPLAFMLDVVGLEKAPLDRVRLWAHAMVGNATTLLQGRGQDEMERLRSEFHAVLDDHTRRVAAGERPVAWLQTLTRSLGLRAAADVAKLLVVAGTETTTHLIGNALGILATRPDVQTLCRSSPDLIPGLVEETLRFDAPVQWTRRRVTRPGTYFDQALPAGAHIIALIGSANRDERRFDRADEFLPRRKPSGHIAFGSGAHHCLGAALARLEARVALGALLDGPLLTLAPGADTLERDPAPQIRGFRRLLLRHSD